MRVSNINRDILRQTMAHLDEATISKFKNLGKWLDGSLLPTFNQMIAYTKAANIPFGYLFLDQLPDNSPTIPHYRTTTNRVVEPSAFLKASIQQIEERQIWAKDLLLELGAEPLPFANRFTVHSEIEKVVSAIANLLQIKRKTWASRLSTWNKALSFLIEQTEAAGIFVVKNGVVGNKNRKALNVEEFRGFVLYDEIAPFIFINGKDAIAGQIFTLIHEIAHVLIGESASFDLSFVESHHNNIEKFCNQVAANFLLPQELVEKYYEEENYSALAKKFKVSQIAVARRLLDIGQINREQFLDFYNRYKQQNFSSTKSKGGNFYNSAPYKVSNRFFGLVNTSLLEGKIRPMDAFRLTGLKAKTYATYLEKSKE
ncbi:MAG: ImmA/IrrE family metallo-endopeptidase [Aureispira sp.]